MRSVFGIMLRFLPSANRFDIQNLEVTVELRPADRFSRCQSLPDLLRSHVLILNQAE